MPTAVAGVVIVAAAAVAQATWGGDSASEVSTVPVSLEGSLLFGNFRSTSVDLPFGDEQERDAVGTGSYELRLPGRQLTGEVSIHFSASFTWAPEVASYFHSWGDIDLRLGALNRCHGSFGWTNFENPLEGGGSMHLRCDDGTMLAATMVATAQPQLSQAGDDMVIDLRDGWYVAGAARSAP